MRNGPVLLDASAEMELEQGFAGENRRSDEIGLTKQIRTSSPRREHAKDLPPLPRRAVRNPFRRRVHGHVLAGTCCWRRF